MTAAAGDVSVRDLSAEAPVAPPQIISVNDAVDLIWEHVLSGRYPEVATACRDLWQRLKFATADRDFLALHGLIQVAAAEQRNTRRGPRGRPAIGVGAPHGKQWDRYMALTWVYTGADGKSKSLFDFTLDDLSYFALSAGEMAQSYERRRAWAVETSEILAAHSKTRVRELPSELLAEVNAAAREAMGRQ